jgi:hypothetical protein
MHFPKVEEGRSTDAVEKAPFPKHPSKVLGQGYCLAGTYFGTVKLFISQHLNSNMQGRWK